MNTNNQLDNIVKLVGQYGFKFFGHDENKQPLVTAPNGQIVPLNIAYNFVMSQVNAQQGSGNIESMPEVQPQMPQAPDNKGLDQGLEKEQNINTIKQPSQPNQQFKAAAPITNPNANKPVVIKQPAPAVNFGEGFRPNSFDITNPASINKYIDQNKDKSSNYSGKWMAELFTKFLEEVKSGNI